MGLTPQADNSFQENAAPKPLVKQVPSFPTLTMMGRHVSLIFEFGGRYASDISNFVGNIVGRSIVRLFIHWRSTFGI